jgi:hypothetical protein
MIIGGRSAHLLILFSLMRGTLTPLQKGVTATYDAVRIILDMGFVQFGN